MSEEQSGGDDQPRPRLDRENLPEEFTPELLRSLTGHDLVWLEDKVDQLTPRQLETFKAGMSEILGPVQTAFSRIGEQLVGKIAWPKIGIKTDPIGQDLRESYERIQESTRASRAVFDAAATSQLEADTRELSDIVGKSLLRNNPATRHAEQQESLQQLHQTFQEVALMMSRLVERTEQQHQAAERQKATNFLLAFIAAASMAGTFATVNSLTHLWLALIATFHLAPRMAPRCPGRGRRRT